jgi:hypothetical protein
VVYPLGAGCQVDDQLPAPVVTTASGGSGVEQTVRRSRHLLQRHEHRQLDPRLLEYPAEALGKGRRSVAQRVGDDLLEIERRQSSLEDRKPLADSAEEAGIANRSSTVRSRSVIEARNRSVNHAHSRPIA